MITEDYVSFETAKLLKERGYCNMSNTLYNENGEFIRYDVGLNNKGYSCILGEFYECPTIQMAMKWLREVHNIYISISHRFSHNADNDVLFSWYINTDLAADGEYVTYEEACEAAIKHCLEKLI